MDLHQYIEILEREGELHRIKAEVDPEYEITEIALRGVKEGGPALLFEKVKGSDFPLIINQNSTKKRLRLGLGEEPGVLGHKLVDLIKDMQPPSFLAAWQNRSTIARALNMRVKKVSGSPVQDYVDQPGDLSRLPVLKCWPKDAGRFFTLPLVNTVSAKNGKTNLGMYRMQVYNKSETGMHWQIVRGAEAHAYDAPSQRMPCAVALGGDPALTLAAIFPLPEDVEELPFAGLLRGSPQKLIKARTQPLWVPANAEFILEGVIDLDDKRVEGPFGDHFGHYSHAGMYPTFKMTALTHRKNAIFPATVVGKPPLEDRVWGEAINEFSAPVLKLMHPEISDFWTWYEAGFHNLLTLSVHQRHHKEGVKTALGLLGQGQLSLCKVVVLLDHHVNPRDMNEILKAVGDNFDPAMDALILPGTPMDTLDFTSYRMNLGSKVILDCTSGKGLAAVKKKKGGKTPRSYNADRVKSLGGNSIDLQKSHSDALLLIRLKKGAKVDSRKLLKKLLQQAPLGTHKWVALVSHDVDLNNSESWIWGLFTRFDAARDMQFTRSRLVGAWPHHEGVLGMDATWKKGYPDPVESPASVIKKVNQRWKKDYGLG